MAQAGVVRADVCVVGAGPAGLAAAVAAAEAGARVLVLEREEFVGGVLPQCVHDGFGLHVHGASLTGPEYAAEWEARARAVGAAVACGTTVLAVEGLAGGGFWVDCVGLALGGHVRVEAGAVVGATGCRERTRGQLGIPGTRPAGVMTAGAAQYLMNVQNQLPGTKAVVLGSGDIGLIMARRLTLEGAQVRLVLGQQATGLLRNHVRCIEDFGIPLRYGWGLASVSGTGRLKGVTVAPMLPNGGLDLARREYVRCNLLLLACGLVPEREALAGAEGAAGLFVCGNARKPHDLADQVTQEGLAAGRAAAAFALGARGAAVAEPSAETRRLLALKVAEQRGRVREAGALAPGERAVPCTLCPASCVVRVGPDGAVRGNGCARGAAYAAEELARPLRTFTGTVRLAGCPGRPLVPVRSAADVPRDALAAVARAARRVRAQAPVARGQVLCRDVAGTGVDLVACADVAAPDAAGGRP